ncbi:hypothetical protein RI129_003910 [Pyrocoelia pectoralis]|uniref:Uncharacterized protein n=1 Tax=Pyrocoelia pectoralis TaxID=417401 RepID=A0AAN7VT92_9COLE
MFAFLATYWMIGMKIVAVPKLSKLTLWEIILNNFWSTISHCYVVFFFVDLIHKEVNRSSEVAAALRSQSLSSPPIRKFVHQLHLQVAQNKISLTAANFIKLGWHQAFLMYGGVISYSTVSSQLY